MRNYEKESFNSKHEDEFLENIEKRIRERRLKGTTWQRRPPIIKFSISPHRKNLKKPPEPVKLSKYAKQLFEIGAGWNEK